MSEVVLGKAIKQHNIPREGIVVMTKLFCAVGKQDDHKFLMRKKADDMGYVNQHGLSRKVRWYPFLPRHSRSSAPVR